MGPSGQVHWVPDLSESGDNLQLVHSGDLQDDFVANNVRQLGAVYAGGAQDGVVSWLQFPLGP